MTDRTSRDWRAASEQTLVVVLTRVEDLARDATSLKDLEGILKLVSEVVGVTTMGGGKGAATGAGGDDDDE